MESVSPSPETPIYVRLRLAALAPVAMEGMRPCTALNPCPPLTKYAVVFDEQPIPESFTTLWGGSASSQQASISAAVMESCPQPAQSVEFAPS